MNSKLAAKDFAIGWSRLVAKDDLMIHCAGAFAGTGLVNYILTYAKFIALHHRGSR
jgi:hypothetical protein